MEVDGRFQVLLEKAYQFGSPCRSDESVGIFEGDDIGPEVLQLLGFVQEIVVLEDRLMKGTSVESGFDPFEGRMVRVDGVADGTIGHSTVTVGVLDGRLHIVYIVHGIEDTHDINS